MFEKKIYFSHSMHFHFLYSRTKHGHKTLLVRTCYPHCMHAPQVDFVYKKRFKNLIDKLTSIIRVQHKRDGES